MTTARKPRRVAIACQGGGSHTAFTAGVLDRLLGAEELARYQIVGLSGASGGAICALLAWCALRDGDRAAAGERLRAFWMDNAARGPLDRWLNAWLVSAGVLQSLDVLPGVSPYAVPRFFDTSRALRKLLAKHIDFDSIETDLQREHPLLVLSAVDVLSGSFRTFCSHSDRITVDEVLASAAIPSLFRAVHTAGGAYWDGLFSQNPPVHDLLGTEPDELWVIQINPLGVEREPRSLMAITERRDELSGNLSLYQELRFIETTDRLLEQGRLRPGGPFRQIVVRVIEMPRRARSRWLGPASKLNRDARFLRGLIKEGQAQADRFLGALAFERAWVAQDPEAVLALAAPNARLISEPPFPAWDPGERDPAKLHGFVTELLARDIRIDSTRKQIAQDRCTWTVRLRGVEDTSVECVVEAGFSGRLISALRLGTRR